MTMISEEDVRLLDEEDYQLPAHKEVMTVIYEEDILSPILYIILKSTAPQTTLC